MGGELPIYDIAWMCGANSPLFRAVRYTISPLFLRKKCMTDPVFHIYDKPPFSKKKVYD